MDTQPLIEGKPELQQKMDALREQFAQRFPNVQVETYYSHPTPEDATEIAFVAILHAPTRRAVATFHEMEGVERLLAVARQMVEDAAGQ